MLSKSEKAIIKKLDPLFTQLLNEECLPFVFSYLDGKRIQSVGSENLKAKMGKQIHVDSSWMKAFKNDEKELLRETETNYFDAEVEGGNLFFIDKARNVSYLGSQKSFFFKPNSIF